MKRRAGGGDPDVGGGDGVLLEIRKMETQTHNTNKITASAKSEVEMARKRKK